MFASNLDHFIKESGHSNVSLSRILKDIYKADVSDSSISKYRKGHRTPTPQVISLICKVLDIPEQALFDRSKLKEIAENEIKNNPNQYIDDKVVIKHYKDDNTIVLDKKVFKDFNTDSLYYLMMEDNELCSIIPLGTRLVFGKDFKFENEKIYHISYYGKDLVRKLIKNDNGSITVISDEDEFIVEKSNLKKLSINSRLFLSLNVVF